MKPVCAFLMLFHLLLLVNKGACGQSAAQGKDFHDWAPTPPMGWNSWDCYGPTVTEDEVKANADYMSKFLRPYGWEYIVVDIRWYVGNDKSHGYNETNPDYSIDAYGRFTPAVNRFPSSADGNGFRKIADYIHAKGLKFGIHIMRGIPKIAVQRNLPVLGTGVKAGEIYNTSELCTWLGDMYTVDGTKQGAQQYYNSIFSLYAHWGVDFVKIDDLSSPYHPGEIEMIRKAIDLSGRKIVLSTSPGETPIRYADHIRKNANMWRTVGDFWDNWPQLKEHFDVCKRWAPYTGNGAYPDADMLPLGHIGIRAERGENRMSRLSRDEQYSLMNLFAVFRSPLMFGGDLPGNDAFTLSLLTNKRVIDILRNSRNNAELFNRDGQIAWIADDQATGDKILALFNTADKEEIAADRAIWTSGLISGATMGQLRSVEKDITGANKIFLVVSDGGDGNSWDHADWINPVVFSGTDTVLLTSVNWVKAGSGWGEARKNRSVSGALLQVNNVVYTTGIGTHANSVIEFDVPEGYSHFRSGYGLDDAGVKQNTGATAKFMVFTSNPAGETPPDSAIISVKLSQLGIKQPCLVQELWTGKKLGKHSEEFSAVLRRHASGIYRISPVKK